MSVRKLECAVQQYQWGKVGQGSEVARLAQNVVSVQEKEPYAELWMGTHVNGPSRMKESKRLLEEELGHPLPYLFKVLSVAKALSIQAHPDKALAEKLHSDRPAVYKDPNHKPEMCVALTPFEAMCGFRSVDTIAAFLSQYPEFRAVVGHDAAASFETTLSQSPSPQATAATLKALFSSYARADAATVQTELAKLLKRCTDSDPNPLSIDRLIPRLASQFPGDVGCFAPFFLNVYRLEPGQALFLGANIPHAYLSGDCLESMACSDNVVRAGLTPKLRDVDVLCSMLTYANGDVDILTGKAIDQFTRVYTPPVQEFALSITRLPSDAPTSYTLSPAQSSHASLVLVVQGSASLNGTCVQKGDVLLVDRDAQVQVDDRRAGEVLLACCYAPC